MEDQTNNNNENTSISISISTTNNNKGDRNNNNNNNNNNNSGEPVRSRWTPKPEQILILESIFNSGMVNPPKEETVRIRKLLEKFGAVGDANVFYWFQNRRSRSRRRQRQLQASLVASALPTTSQPQPPMFGGSGGGANLYDFGHPHQNSMINNTCTTSDASSLGASSSITGFAPSFGNCGTVDDVFATFSAHMPTDCSSTSHPNNLDFQSEIITVFINGVATQVPEGALDMKAMFGEEVILVHSSGVPVPFNNFGISVQSLQHGESYFLVPRIA